MLDNYGASNSIQGLCLIITPLKQGRHSFIRPSYSDCLPWEQPLANRGTDTRQTPTRRLRSWSTSGEESYPAGREKVKTSQFLQKETPNEYKIDVLGA